MGLDLDNFIEYHLQASKSINGKYLKYTMDELEQLCKLSIEVLGKEPTLVKISAPCVIVGDIHGQYYDLLRMFSFYSNGDITGALARQYVFLGDYVDRGRHSLECVCLVLALKIRFPTHYQVLRGNHESTNINRVYGFLDELLDRFGKPDGEKLWEKFNEVFSWMPLAGLVGNRILCMHGGISPELKSFDDIIKIKRPLPDISVSQLALDLLWADPMQGLSGFTPNKVRGVSYFFGQDEVYKVCKNLNLGMIVRGHQVMHAGFGVFANRKLMTIFTAPRYQQDKNDNPNSGATLSVDKAGKVGIHVLQPKEGEPITGTGGTDDDQKSESGSCFFGKEEEGTVEKRKKKSKTTGSKNERTKKSAK